MSQVDAATTPCAPLHGRTRSPQRLGPCEEAAAITWLLLENRIALLALLAVLEFVLLWAWARRRTRRWRMAVYASFALGPLLLMVQAMVVTDREAIIALCRELAWAAEDGDVASIGGQISPGFAEGSMDRAEFLAALEGVLTRVKVEDPRLTRFEVSCAAGRGRVVFDARARLVSSEYIEAVRQSRWELTLERTGDGWRVVAMQPRPTPFFPFSSLAEVLRQR
ncbi:MAG: hypothetical protein GY842_19655 [bacterium]|nr:hypothetical protein [bacterium]